MSRPGPDRAPARDPARQSRETHQEGSPGTSAHPPRTGTGTRDRANGPAPRTETGKERGGGGREGDPGRCECDRGADNGAGSWTAGETTGGRAWTRRGSTFSARLPIGTPMSDGTLAELRPFEVEMFEPHDCVHFAELEPAREYWREVPLSRSPVLRDLRENRVIEQHNR